ncbi:MAG: 2-amino-4-hydroxy-6-hydroxymethyldihydropteridine diphosphokinase [Bacteroides sp.]|nr:2-amino-4-hydroxy-6-hydroxymethyldihydropteridine diphosphokinase [Bacillota bacterium]MCM1394089.1 2-amino-4-hydroxy-6-hydroxymethyldihydropteridine diphosphokinase [[Eubacterium] siraeum]MCM1455165.1 2-amino-4-hydroxy-6-hydroxymethyldihydropteridine diphosphokinase [Bacteroides sp.]
MDRIILKDFEVLACHGVNPEEKVNKQRFIFTAELDVDFERAAELDDINETVSYAAVKKAIKAFCEDNCFDLIETLAARLAERLLKDFPLARRVELTVKKPDAPMSGKFEYAGVRVAREWHKVYLALGSSEGDKSGYLDFAIAALEADDNFKDIRESSRIASEPYGGVAKGEFLNSAVECDTLYSPRKLLSVLHAIEKNGGRVRGERWGDRTLDIDIIFYDDCVISLPDLCVPHPDMQNRYFVLAPLCELNPNIVHPLLNRRIGELLDALNTK